VKTSKFAGKTAFEYQRFEYWNQRGELVSRGYNMLVRYERQAARSRSEEGKGKYDYIKVPHPWEPIYGVHYSVAAAKAVGARYAYDIGVQRHCWLVNLLTHWMGDEGWLKSCNAQYRRFVYHSDVVWFRGKVTKKYVDDNGEYCVGIETHGINQRGEDTIPGHSTVILPSREKGTWPVERRLPAKEFGGTGKGACFNDKN